MDRGIKSLLLQSAIQMQLHVACALEFFEDQFVHSAAGFSQSSRQYRQAAAFLRISRRAEKFLRLNERLRFDAPDIIRPLPGSRLLYPRERRVRLSSRITTSCFISTRRLARSNTISATCTCRCTLSS